MRIDMYHSHWVAPPDRAEDWVRDGVIATHSEWNHSGVHDFFEKQLNVFVRLLQAKPTAERHVAHVSQVMMNGGGQAKNMLKWTDALDCSDGAGTKPGT
jgi:hypothetical protein